MVMLHNGKLCLVVVVAEGYHFILTLAESFWAWSLAVFNFALSLLPISQRAVGLSDCSSRDEQGNCHKS